MYYRGRELSSTGVWVGPGMVTNAYHANTWKMAARAGVDQEFETSLGHLRSGAPALQLSLPTLVFHDIDLVLQSGTFPSWI